MRSGIHSLPLRTPTLPPATTTNTYFVGTERPIVVDPATYEDSERGKLIQAARAIERTSAKIQAIVLTHHHPDHVGSADWLREELKIPTLAHEKTKELLRPNTAVDGTLSDGDTIDVGFELTVLHTPGHAPGHLVLLDQREEQRPTLIIGDMVASEGMIIIDPPEGDMASYIAELRRLKALKPRLLFPAHGPVIEDGEEKLQDYIDHRLLREAKVLSALEEKGISDPEGLLPRAYDDTPESLYFLAARSCLAHLQKLVVEGRARVEDGRFAVMRPV